MAGSKCLIRPLCVLVDMDGVMCDFENHMLLEFRKRYPLEPFVSPADRRTFYMAEQYEKLKPGLAVRKFVLFEDLAIHSKCFCLLIVVECLISNALKLLDYLDIFTF